LEEEEGNNDFTETEIMRRLEGGESQSVVIAACNIGFATVFDMKKQKDQ
jgi:hypothetical protein